MKTVGQLLKETRIEKGLTIDQVAKATKIQKRYIEALETDEFKQIESQAYTIGFVKNYSEFLGLNSKHVLAFLRRQTREISKSALLPKKTEEELQTSRIRLTPSRFIVFFITFLLLLFVGYFVVQYQRLQAPPTLVIEQPKENETILNAPRIEVLGQTDSDATVSINGIGVLVRDDGKFFDQVQVFPGKNTIVITATSRYGKTTQVNREITVPEVSE